MKRGYTTAEYMRWASRLRLRPLAAYGHMPFPGSRTVAQIDALRRDIAKRSADFGYEG